MEFVLFIFALLVLTIIVALFRNRQDGLSARIARLEAAVVQLRSEVHGEKVSLPESKVLSSGTACLLTLGYASFPRFLSAEAAAIALALIFAGLFACVRAARIVGILLLAGTLVRLFVFDIGETVWRIAAFTGAAVVLFLLGYAYRKRSRKIEDDTE